MTDFQKLKQKLPSKENFYSFWTGKKNKKNKEDEHNLNAWNKFKTKTMKGYHGLYLKCDVLLLAGVFERYRNNSLKNHGLCPSHYLTWFKLGCNA